MSAEEITTLTQEEMDVVIYDARVGDLETLQEIFEEITPKTLTSVKDDITLSTPIHMSSANGHLEVVKYLLSILSKEDATKLVAQKNENGNTALHWAAYNGHLEIVKLLVEEYEADAFVKNEAGHDPIYEAENNNQFEIENWFLKKYTVEEDFKVEEDGEDTKITYKPGTESKLADEQARDASFAAAATASSSSEPASSKTLEQETEKLSLDK